MAAGRPDKRQITKHRFEELRKEFTRLVSLKWKTVAEYGKQPEIEEARRKISGTTKRKNDGMGRDGAACKRGRTSSS